MKPDEVWQAERMAESSDDGAVVVIGVFDGVHRGHRALVDSARGDADRRGLPLVALTFDPHPLSVLRPEAAPALLATSAFRERLLLGAGADQVEVLSFTPELAAMSPLDFVDEILANRLNAACVVVGENFRFGRGASGTVDDLRELGAPRGIDVSPLPLVADGADVVSSTQVRRLIADGDVEAAARALTRPHRVQGTVVHGDHRGRELGYPTANLGDTGTLAIPADGVYAAILVLEPDGDATTVWPAAVSVGTNPTFGENSRRVEAFAIDAGEHLDLYGREVGVDFVARLRPMEQFDGIEPLLHQMAIDVERARTIVSQGPLSDDVVG